MLKVCGSCPIVNRGYKEVEKLTSRGMRGAVRERLDAALRTHIHLLVRPNELANSRVDRHLLHDNGWQQDSPQHVLELDGEQRVWGPCISELAHEQEQFEDFVRLLTTGGQPQKRL